LFTTTGNEFVEIEFEIGRTCEIDAYIEILDKGPSSEYTFKTKQNNESYIETNPFEFIYIKLPTFLSENNLKLSVHPNISIIRKREN